MGDVWGQKNNQWFSGDLPANHWPFVFTIAEHVHGLLIASVITLKPDEQKGLPKPE